MRGGQFVNLQNPLTINECLDLLERETAESERQLKKRQLEIVMRLKQHNCGLIPDETVIEIANALMAIVKLRLYGPESLASTTYKIEPKEYYGLGLVRY